MLFIDSTTLSYEPTSTSTSTAPEPSHIERVRIVLEALAHPDNKPANVLGVGEDERERTRTARRTLRELARKYPTLRSAAIVALLVHFPRIGRSSAGEFSTRTPHPFTPSTPPVFDWCASTSASAGAVRSGAVGGWDWCDEIAAREGSALAVLADINGCGIPQHPYIERGREIETAALYGRTAPARNSAHFQTANAVRGDARVATGGEGKREIVTRNDKARRAINTAARRLDVVEAQIKRDTPDNAVALAALALVRSMLASA